MCISNHKTFTQENYRRELITSINASHERLVNAVNLFNAHKAIEPINSDTLRTFEFFKWVELNDKVKVRRRRDRFNEKYLSFDTEMLEGGEFGEHFHADLIESTEVISGEMYDTYDQRYYRDGEVAQYDKGQKHTPIATKKTILHVLFKP
tara:strand:+ start:3101 stop:3550 length:450 start_codon:yes stop_codon:yes gene_type:complete